MPKIVNHGEYRTELLEKSFELFARRGYEITMRELAGELEISTGTLYHYFSSKEDIFKQTMTHVSHKQVNLIVSGFNSTRPDERVISLFHYILKNEKFFQNILFLIIDYYRQHDCSDPDLIIREMSDYYKKAISDKLGISNNVLSSMFFSFILGIVIHRILDPDTANWDEQVQMMKTMVLFFVGSGLQTG